MTTRRRLRNLSCLRLRDLEERVVPSVVMVRDINTNPSDSRPYGLTAVNNNVYFAAYGETAHAAELWRSDGNPAGTVRVSTGPTNMAPLTMRSVGDRLFFFTGSTPPNRLWVTDGTEAATYPVGASVNFDGSAASFYGTAGSQTAVGDTYYFAGYPSGDGSELWKSDGTAEGTVRVKDIRVGTAGSSPRLLTPAANWLYFVADDGTSGAELWRSDGTDAGTYRVADLRVGSASSYPTELTAVGNTLYFFADDGVNGRGLYRYDEGASLVRLTDTPNYSQSWTKITVVQNAIYYNLGTQLWKSNGTPSGTVLVATIPNNSGQSFVGFQALNESLFFVARDNTHGYEPWISDGTAAGTRLIKDLYSGSYPDVFDPFPRQMVRIGGVVYFISSYSDLWRSDGTTAGTSLVKTFDVLSSQSYPDQLTAIGETLMLVADDAAAGYELWRSDGTPAGTKIVRDIRPGSVASDAVAIGTAGSALYIRADDIVREVHSTLNMPALWVSHGNEAETSYLFTNGILGFPTGPFPLAVNSTAFYFSSKRGLIDQLFKTTGTSQTTILIGDGVRAAEAEPLGSGILFANDELWFSDGTAAGTRLLKDIRPGASGSSPRELTRLGNAVYFVADDGTSGAELWVSDGTEDRTALLKDIRPGSSPSRPHLLTVAGSYLYFVASDGVTGDELWRTDGTSAGTMLVKDINSSGWAAGPTNLTAIGSTLYFTVDDGVHGSELWKSDGTGSGTVMVRDISSGQSSSFPRNLTAVGNSLFFTAKSGGTSGLTELWKSDGTPSGTVRVKSGVWGNFAADIPRSLTAAGDLLFFVANDGTTGSELWRSDGTDAGTVLAEDVYPGVRSSNPKGLFAFNNTLYFTANDGFHGDELWRVDDAGTSTRIDDVIDISPDPRSSPVDSIDVVFSGPDIEGTFDAEDVVLERDGVSIALPESATVQPVAGSTYRISGLSSVTAASGHYLIGIRGSGIRDADGRIVGGTATDTWVFTDTVGPVADEVMDVTPNPRTAALGAAYVKFSEPVSLATFTYGDLVLQRDGRVIPLSSSVTTSLVGGFIYRISGLAEDTSADGSYTLTVVASGIADAAGNSGTGSASVAWVKDTAAPPAPTVVGISSDSGADATDGMTSDQTLVVKGTSEANSTVTVFRDGTKIGIVSTDALGTWKLDDTGTTLLEGTYQFTARATDAAGNQSGESSAFRVVVDVTPPAAPSVVSVTEDTGASASDGVTSDARLIVHGTAQTNIVVTILLDGQVVGTSVPDASGGWSFDYTATAISDGAHVISARAIDLAGNLSSDSSDFNLWIDSQAPAPAVIASISTDTGHSDTDGVTNDRTLIVYGTAEPNSILTLRRNGSVIGNTTVDAAGTWDFDATGLALDDGLYNFTAFATDRAGNMSAEFDGYEVLVDTQAPAAPIIERISEDRGTADDDFLTNDRTLRLSGTSEPNSTLAVYRGGRLVGSIIADSAGRWSFDDPATLDEGVYEFVARSIDAAGNTSGDSATLSVTVDLSVAVPTIDQVLPDTGISGSDGVTANSQPRLVGMAEPNSRVAIFRDGSEIDAIVADESGNWLYDSAPVGLADGSYRFTVVATDLAGNVSARSTDFDIAVDTQAPAPPSVVGISTDSGNDPSDGVTNDPTLIVFGTAELDTLIRLFRGGTELGEVFADLAGDWSFDYSSASLPDGGYHFVALAIDTAGNVSGLSDAYEITVDTLKPEAPTIAAVNTDTGIDSADRVTNDATLVLTGSAEPQSRVTVLLDGQPIGTVDANENGGWVFDHSGDTVPDGDHTFTAKATDRAGNSGPESSPVSIRVDTALPIANFNPVIPNPRSVSVSSIELVFSEPVYGLEVVHLQLFLDGGGNLLSDSATLTTSDQVTWSLGNLESVTSELGAYTIRLSALGSGVTDRAGNVLESDASATWIMNNNAPVLIPGRTVPLEPIPRNTTEPAGTVISAFVADGISDADDNALDGIAVTALTQTEQGDWQYSLNDGAQWLSFGAVSGASARLLRHRDLVRFVPNAGFVGTAGLTYHAWDQTHGLPGGVGDLVQTGGTTAFSTASDTATLKVATTMLPVPEDTTPLKGDTVGSVFGVFIQDVDVKAKMGIAAVGVTGNDNGNWQYLSGAGGWKGLGDISPSRAILLREMDRVRFVPGPEFQGNATIHFHAWDQTSGKAGSSVDLTAVGATGAGTAFSAARDLAFVQVTPVNDAPVLDIGDEPPLTPVNTDDSDPPGDLISTILGSTVTDADHDPIGMAIIAAIGKGTWQYQLDGSSTWEPVGRISARTPLHLSANDLVRFVQTPGFVGTAILKYRAWDGTATSRLIEIARLRVTDEPVEPANTAPTLDTTVSPGFTSLPEESRSPRGDTVASLLGSSVADPNPGALFGIAVTGGTGGGTWQYSLTNGRSWKPIGLASESNALLLRDTDKLRFVPAKDWFGAATLDYHAWDRSRGSAGGRASLLVGTGGSSPFSIDHETASVEVTPVNDAPILDIRPMRMLHIGGDTVSSLLGNSASDVDGDALSMAIIAATGRGEWLADTGNGWEWLGAVSNRAPRLLDAAARVRFEPATGFVGVARLLYRAWDGTTTSRAIENAALTINSVDDRPVLDTRGNPILMPVRKDDVNSAGDLVSSLLGTLATDADPEAELGIAIIAAQTTGGYWEIDTGNGWEDLGMVSGRSPRRLLGDDRIRFVPNAGFVGSAKLLYRAWDAASVDPNSPLSWSTAVEVATVTVNTAPELSV